MTPLDSAMANIAEMIASLKRQDLSADDACRFTAYYFHVQGSSTD